MFKIKTSWSKTKTKTFIVVLEVPRDQDPGLEHYITGLMSHKKENQESNFMWRMAVNTVRVFVQHLNTINP